MTRFVTDLRDRRLLPIIALLVVCLVAVPFLLGGGDDDTSPSPAASADAAAPLPGIETRPVVIASPAELRNYSKRLASFDSRNPFHQDLPKPVEESSGTAVDGAAPVTDTGIPDTGAAPTAPTTTPSIDVPTTPTTPPDTGGNEDTGDKLISIRIDVEAGRAGRVKPIDDVKALDFLPDPQHPVVQYIGGTFDLTKAAFVVNSGIEATDGEGKCAPSPDNCQFLMLKVGQEQTFVYRAEEYRLKLVEVKEHVTPLSGSEETPGKEPSGARGSVRNSNSAVQRG